MEVGGFPLPFHVSVRIAFCLRFCDYPAAKGEMPNG